MLSATYTALLHTNYTVQNKNTADTIGLTMCGHSIIPQQILYCKTEHFNTPPKKTAQHKNKWHKWVLQWENIGLITSSKVHCTVSKCHNFKIHCSNYFTWTLDFKGNNLVISLKCTKWIKIYSIWLASSSVTYKSLSVCHNLLWSCILTLLFFAAESVSLMVMSLFCQTSITHFSLPI